MNNQEILDGNKLIAEFMGFKKCNCIRNENGRYYDYHLSDKFELIKEVKICIEGEHGTGLENQDICFIEDLKFHSSWDWLMPVIDKIESLDLRKNGCDFPKVKFMGNYIEIFCYASYRSILCYWKDWMSINGNFHKHHNQCESKILAVFSAVVEFIKWYNNNKKL